LNERHFILSLAEKECAKQLEKIQKQIAKTSLLLFQLNDSNSTVKRRAMMRARLASDCEERDRWKERLMLIERWKEEIRHAGTDTATHTETRTRD
jgi:hypothetical protein